MDLEPSSEDEVAVRRDPRFFFLLSSTSTITATETSTLTAFTGEKKYVQINEIKILS